MDFEFNDDQRLLRKTVTEFVKKESPVERFRRLREDPVGYEASVWRMMGELGWLAVSYPESVGGFAGSFIASALILEQFGHTLVPEPFLASVVVAGRALLLGGTPEQHERVLVPMLEGRTTLAFAHTERGGALPTTQAQSKGKEYVLNGEKTFVLNGHAADHIIVSASVGKDLALFLLEKNHPGVSIQTVALMDGHRAAKIRFEGVKLRDDQRLPCDGAVRGAAAVVRRVFDYGAAGTVAEGLGVCDRSLGMTVEYLNMREQFGSKIGAFQALQHRAVDMFVETELLRSVFMLAIASVDLDDDEARQSAISAAKAQLSTAGQLVVRQSVQLHGGIGVTDEHDIGLYFKRMHTLFTMFGDADDHVRRYMARSAFSDAYN